MNTIKDSLLIKEHWPKTKIYVFYVDIRAYGKGFEDLYRRAKEEGVVFIRGLPADVIEDKKTGNLWLIGENTLQKGLYKVNAGMAILSIGIEPRRDSEARTLQSQCWNDNPIDRNRAKARQRSNSTLLHAFQNLRRILHGSPSKTAPCRHTNGRSIPCGHC
jgi:heterodisulfide reductase subunit A-like polyferredoxin